MRICLVLPPLTQLNTPYPSTGYLLRHLREQGIDCTQRDLGIELVLKLFSRDGLRDIFDHLADQDELPSPAWRALAMREQHESIIESVIRLLQGRDRTMANRILETPYLPMGPRLEQANLEAFGELGQDDGARHLATLYIEDLADLITACIDDGFGLASYGAHLATGPVGFDSIATRLEETTLVDSYLDALADTLDADVVGLSVPFPGNLYSALRMGRRLRAQGKTVLMGGGYVNTELRETDEPRLWECVDALTYDDGEGPLVAWLEHMQGGPDNRHRTRTRDGLIDNPAPRPPMTAAAAYDDLPLSRYLNLVDTKNPAHRLWSDGRWNKITLAHGCYWKKCSFCDVSLDYIAHYEKAQVSNLVTTIESLCEETGTHGFHFVDEAAPPQMMKALAIELLRRRVQIAWWGNIRFEATFTPDLCRLLAAAGLITVTGGLEVASNRLLKAMNKGVTVEQVTQAASAFRQAGVMVHAYLMYGFPTQTDQETIDSMELVRQLFENQTINSAFWHRFVLTRHAPMFSSPKQYGMDVVPNPTGTFSSNDHRHHDPQGGNHDAFDAILPKALDAWMQGRELDRPVHTWFPNAAPKTSEKPNRIRRALRASQKTGTRLLWIGGEVLEADGALHLYTPDSTTVIPGTSEELEWLGEVIEAAAVDAEEPLHLGDVEAAFPGEWANFEERFDQVRDAGLLLI